MRKLICALVVFTMVFGTSTISFAGTIQNDDLTVTPISEDSFILSDGEDTATVNVSENASEMRVEIDSVSGDASDDGYFLVDKETDMIYSSFTGQYLGIDEITVKNNSQISDSGSISVTAVGDVVWSKDYKVSYAALSKVVDASSSGLTIATAIITVAAALSGVTIATSATVVLALLPVGLETIKAGIKNKSSSHGLKVTVQKVEIQKSQGGKKVKGYSYKIKSVGTY